MTKIHIAIAEDNQMALKAIEGKLTNYPDLEVKLKVFNGKMLKEQIDSCRIDLVLMDIDMPIMNGIEATQELKKSFPQIKFLMLATFDEDERIFDAVLSGASGYLLKEASKENIYQAILETIDGGATMSSMLATRILNLIQTSLFFHFPKYDFGLCSYEIELLEQLKNGLTYEQLATNMNITASAVRGYIEKMYLKLRLNGKINVEKHYHQ